MRRIKVRYLISNGNTSTAHHKHERNEKRKQMKYSIRKSFVKNKGNVFVSTTHHWQKHKLF